MSTTITGKHSFDNFSWLSLMPTLFTSLSTVINEMELLKVREKKEIMIKLETEEKG